MQINNKLLNYWYRNIEVVICFVWLLCFLDLRLPSFLMSLAKALSYPVIATLVIFRCQQIFYAATRDVSLIFYVAIAIASIYWTTNPENTMDSIRGLVRMFLFGAYFATRYTIKEQMTILAWVLRFVAFLSLTAVLVRPSFGIGAEGWLGVFSYKNYMGYTMSMTSVLFLLLFEFKNQGQKWLGWVSWIVTIILIVFSRSAGSWINAVILLSLIPLYRLIKQNYKLRVVIFSGACVLAIGTVLLILVNLQTILVDILGKGVEFNGRTPIWTLVIEKGLEKPWLGYGLNAFWSSDAGTYIMINTWAGLRDSFNSHNSFLELFLNLGLIGLFVFMISLCTAFHRVLTLLFLSKKVEYFWFFMALTFMCLAGFADTNFVMSPSSSFTCIYISMTLSAKLECERLRRNHLVNKSVVTPS